MSLSKNLKTQVDIGRNGKQHIIPVPYERLGEYIDIAKNTMYTIGGESGSGKSTLAQDMFIIQPIRWYLKNQNPDVKLSIIYFGMERKLYQYSARWVSRIIFEEYGESIHPKKILGRKENFQLTPREHELVEICYATLDEWEKNDLLLVHENSKNSSGISIYLEEFAKRHGTIHKRDKEAEKTLDNILAGDTYTPNHPNHIVLVITDHIGILAPEKSGDNDPKIQIDKFSRTMRIARDVYGFSPVVIQQLNRSISGSDRQKAEEVFPKLSDFAGSSSTQNDSDVIMALYEAFRHKGSDPGIENGYTLKKLKDDKFRTWYRSLHILKNSFDSAGMNYPMALHPLHGIFKTLPRKDNITEDVYEQVMTGMYFLK